MHKNRCRIITRMESVGKYWLSWNCLAFALLKCKFQISTISPCVMLKYGHVTTFNPMWPSDPICRHWTWSSLVQVLARRLFDANPELDWRHCSHQHCCTEETNHYRGHNGRDGVSNHRPDDCLLSRLFRHRSKKTSKLRVTGFCEGNSPVTGEFPAQMASNAENVSIWWRHHG